MLNTNKTNKTIKTCFLFVFYKRRACFICFIFKCPPPLGWGILISLGYFRSTWILWHPVAFWGTRQRRRHRRYFLCHAVFQRTLPHRGIGGGESTRVDLRLIALTRRIRVRSPRRGKAPNTGARRDRAWCEHVASSRAAYLVTCVSNKRRGASQACSERRTWWGWGFGGKGS